MKVFFLDEILPKLVGTLGKQKLVEMIEKTENEMESYTKSKETKTNIKPNKIKSYKQYKETYFKEKDHTLSIDSDDIQLTGVDMDSSIVTGRTDVSMDLVLKGDTTQKKVKEFVEENIEQKLKETFDKKYEGEVWIEDDEKVMGHVYKNNEDSNPKSSTSS